MKLLTQYLAVAGAGALGAMLRMFVGTVCGRMFGTGFPVGTFIVNITGCFLLGWFLTLADHRTIPDALRLAVAVGFVGAYTTFSTFMYESNALLEGGAQIKVLLNLVASLAVGLLAVRAGIWVARG